MKVYLIVYLILLIDIGLADDPAFLTVGQISVGGASQTTQFRTIKLLNIQKLQQNYLFFMATPYRGSHYQNIKMAIFRSNQQKPLVICDTTIHDACYIDVTHLKADDSLIAVIQCSEDCQFQFSSYWSSVQVLKPGEDVKFLFTEIGQAQIVHINLEETDYSQVRLILVPQTKRAIGDSIKMYGNYDYINQPSQEAYDFQSVPIWKGGQGIFLKKQQMKAKQLSILVIGQSKIVYQLKCIIVNKKNQYQIALKDKLYQYLKKDQQRIYHLEFKSQQIATQYIFSQSKFLGSAQVKFYTDKEMKNEVTPHKFSYMEDSKYIFLTQELVSIKIQQLWIKIKSQTQNALYILELTARNPQNAVQLYQQIYDFIPVVDKQQLAYVNFVHFIDNNKPNQKISLNVNFLRVVGDFILEFRLCTSQLINCISLDKYQKNSKILDISKSGNIGMKDTFKIQIDPKQLSSMNQYQLKGVLIIVLKNKVEKASLIALQYTPGSSIVDLRQGHPLEEIIGSNQIKYYKFESADPSIKSIKIRVTQIRGSVTVTGFRKDPTVSTGLQKHAIGHVIEYKQDLSKPVYIKIEGSPQSAFGIIAHIIRASPELSSISLTEDIEYNIRIQPSSGEILKVNPIFQSLFLKYKASSMVGICIKGSSNKQHNCQNPNVGKQGQIKIQNFKDQTGSILVINPSSQAYVEFSVSYHSADYDHCQQRKIGQLYNQVVKDKQCLNFQLKDPIESIGMFLQRIDLGPFAIKIYACYQQIPSQWVLPKIIINEKDILKRCSDMNITDKVLTVMIVGDPQKPKESLKLQYSTQYQNSAINLPDGVAYKINGKSVQGPLKTFYYKLINLLDTTILLRSMRGSFQFYAKIVSPQEKDIIPINKNDYAYNSKSTNFYRNPSLTILKQDFMAHHCQVCGVLISIYSIQDIGGLIQFSIQVYQKSIVLKDNQLLSNYLIKDSTAYYQYQSNKKQNCNLIIQVADNNKDCTNLYLSKLENPSDQQYLVKESGNKMTYPGCQQGIYYIAVQATDDCPYSISISNSPLSMNKIERGIPVNLKLKQGQIKYLVFRHITKNGFKLLTMHKFGSVQIYVNQLDPQHLDKLKDHTSISYNDFKFKTKAFNSLVILPTDDGFCVDCYYIAVVVAKFATQSSIILADQQTAITLAENKMLNDDIYGKGSTTNLTFSNVLYGQLPILVHNGQLQATLSYKDQYSTYTFKKMRQIQKFTFKIKTDTDQTYDWSPINVKVKCLTQNCVYSIGLVDNSLQDLAKQKIKIAPGRPSYMFLNPNVLQCMTGYLKEQGQQVLVTVDRQMSSALKQMDVKLLVNGKQSKDYIRNVISNVMKLQIDQKNNKIDLPSSYQICLESKKNIPVSTIIQQGEDVNLLPQDAQVIVKNQDTFLVYPQGPFIIDIFSCVGNAQFRQSTSQSDISNNSTMSGLNVIGMPDQSHAIKVTSFLPTFLRIKSQLSLVRWFPIDQIKQKGIGYIKYAIGQLKYNTNPQTIHLVWTSLLKKSETKTKIKNINYKLYISNDDKHVKSASQCQRFYNDDIVRIDLNISNDQILDTQLCYDINKSFILEKFKDIKNLYFTIVADMALQPPKQLSDETVQQQYYRFLYAQQQLPSDVFNSGYNSQVLNIIGVVVVVSLGLLIASYVILKKLIPMISRMKNRMLIEDPQGDNQPQQKQNQNFDQQIQSNQRIVVDLS